MLFNEAEKASIANAIANAGYDAEKYEVIDSPKVATVRLLIHGDGGKNSRLTWLTPPGKDNRYGPDEHYVDQWRYHIAGSSIPHETLTNVGAAADYAAAIVALIDTLEERVRENGRHKEAQEETR